MYWTRVWSHMYWTRVWSSWLGCTYQVFRVDQWTSLWRSQRADSEGGYKHHVNFWLSSSSAMVRAMVHSTILLRLQRLMIAPAAWFAEGCHIHNSIIRRGGVLCDVLVPCMHHYGSFCPWWRLERQPAPRSKPLPIMRCDHRPRHHQRNGRAPERGQRQPTRWILI